MNPLVVIHLTSEIEGATSVSDINLIARKYGHMQDPYVQYALANVYQVYNQYQEAIPYLLKACQLGSENLKTYSSTPYSDSIGAASMSLLTDYPEYVVSSKIQYQLFENSYYFLSKSITMFGLKAYESFRNRAGLLCIQNGIPNKFIMTHSIGQIIEVLILSDFFFAAKAYFNQGLYQESQKLMNQAVINHDWLDDMSIAGKDADEYELEELALLGQQRHKIIMDKHGILFEKQTPVIDVNAIRAVFNR